MWEASKKALSASENDEFRSNFTRGLIQTNCVSSHTQANRFSHIPKVIVQFWHDKTIPGDVRECAKTWAQLEDSGYTHKIFNINDAEDFINEKLGKRQVEAFDRCYHPAMKSDYFRLCYIFSNGGFYVDTDDVYTGINIDPFFENKKLNLQPLCYDLNSNTMIPPEKFIGDRPFSNKWIFYFNNNPIIAPAKDPVIEYALRRSTNIILDCDTTDLPEIQSTTGPGNLTASIVAYFLTNESLIPEEHLNVLSDWNNIVSTVWDLSYRKDNRNWRLSNRKNYWDLLTKEK